MTTQNQNIMKILIAPDKFKGSLTSSQAATAIKAGIEKAVHHSAVGQSVPENDTFCAQNEGKVALGNTEAVKCATGLEFRTVEIADGGDGSLEVLQKKLSGARVVEVTVHDPLGREVPSQVLLYRMQVASAGAEKMSDSRPGDGALCAFIEMAKVSGLEMLSREERNPLHTSTYGMGEAIKAAVTHGVTQITLSIGGSATNDGGAGMLQALGYKFLDASGKEIAVPICGGDLRSVAEVVAPAADLQAGGGANLSGIEFKVICDVTNPLLGPEGATAVYGPQKGADAQALQQLEAGLANYAAVTERCLGVPQSCKEFPGAGAAGGVGYAGLAFLRAGLIPGWRFFAQITSLEESVQWADLVITGEGSLDSQSLSGKVVSGVLNLAAQYSKGVAIFCGVNKLAAEEMDAMARVLPNGVRCYSIASLGYPLAVCMSRAAVLLQQLAESAFSSK